MKQPLISIIIPLHWGLKPENLERFLWDLRKYIKLNYKKFEIILVTEKKVSLPHISKRINNLVINKSCGPAEKRDFALKYARGDICAFIDDDAYPAKNWLKSAIINFRDKNIIAVGGSGITPKEDSFMQKLGGLVYESIFISWGFQERFIIGKKKRVYDWPAYNLLVRTKILKEVGGYGNFFYGGEDTFLCLKLLQKGILIYEPKAFVYHHRRPLFLPHLKQILNVGVHRGYFARVFPKTSRGLIYFMPSILTSGFIILLILSIYSKFIMLVFLTIFSAFLLISFISVLPKTNILGAILSSVGVVLTHVVYGVGFMKGFVIKELKS